MPYMQRTRILSDSDLDDAATWRERIDLAGKVTAIEMRINCDRYATRADNDAVYPLEKAITKIELLRDATTPLISLSGQQLDAMNYWDFKRPNPRRYRQEADTGNDVILFLLGGRDLYDREYGWDFDKLSKVYLEYTYNLHEDTAEYFAASDHDIKLYAWQWMGEGVPSFKGFMRSRQLDSWTTAAASAEHKVEIASANPIRRVAVQSLTRTATLGGAFSQLDLQVGKGEYSPVVVKSPMDWCMAEVAEYGLDNEVGGIDYAISTSECDLPDWFSYYESIVAQGYGYAGECNLEVHFITLPPRVKANTTGGDEVSFQMRGWGFQKCLRIGFDHDYDGYDLLRVPSNKALDLVVTEAAASKEAKCFVQDVVPY
jgi:hypothetical protein